MSTISKISHKKGVEHVTPVVVGFVVGSINSCMVHLKPSCQCTGQDHLHIAILCCMAHILTTIIVDAYSINKPIHLHSLHHQSPCVNYNRMLYCMSSCWRIIVRIWNLSISTLGFYKISQEMG